MKYCYYKKDQTVFEYGTTGTAMFIILKGSVKVLYPSNDGESKYVEVNRQGNGTSFGELAIINKKPRSATIVCAEDSHLAMILVKDYNKLIRMHDDNRFCLLSNFFKQIPLFSKWGKVGLVKLQSNFSEVRCKKGDLIYGNNTKAAYIYVIKEGEFEVL